MPTYPAMQVPCQPTCTSFIHVTNPTIQTQPIDITTQSHTDTHITLTGESAQVQLNNTRRLAHRMQYTNPVMIHISKGVNMINPEVLTSVALGISIASMVYGLCYQK